MTIELNEQQAGLIRETLETVLEEESMMSMYFKTVARQIISKINEESI